MSSASAVHLGPGKQPPLGVLATSAVNGLGLSSHQSWAFWRAQGKEISATPFICENGQQAPMVPLRTLNPKSWGERRLIPLVTEALEALLPEMEQLPRGARIAVILCLGERFVNGAPSYFAAQRRGLEAALAQWMSRHGLTHTLSTVARGHAAFAFALAEATAVLGRRQADAVLVGGADTYYDPVVVDELGAQRRLFDGKNVEAMIGGEGAAFALMIQGTSVRASRPAPAFIESVATDQEPNTLLSAAPCLGEGLTRVLRQVSDRLKRERRKLDWLITDVNHEPYRAQELQLAFPRAMAPGGLDTAGRTYQEVTSPEMRSDFPARRFGDLGAATLPTFLALAWESFSRRSVEARTCLLVAGSPQGDRGAILVTAGAG
jgi:3-oxoacyl-[acyl-carrier-protein] synthase-1